MKGLSEADRALMLRVSKMDLGEPLPPLDELFLHVWAEHYARIVGLSRPARGTLTLEVGLGYGIIAAVLSSLGERVVSTEHPSRAYLLKGEYRAFIHERGVLPVANDLGDGLPFSSGSFHKVLYCDVIEHLPVEMVKGQVAELHRVLRPGGVLVLSTPNLARLWNRLRFLSGRPVNPPIEVRRVGETFDHIREYLWEELCPIFEGAGFQVEEVEYGWIPHFNGESPSGMVNRLTKVVMPIFPRLGDEFYVRMVKR